MAIKPIFIFSLPRAGSTLLQRIIATHPQIATASEPWLLLPFIYAQRDTGTYSEYNHHTMYNALSEFIENLPEGHQTYNQLLRQFILGLYSKSANDKQIYFIDKTPRYHTISQEIIDLFPDAKFIFLWRNPLSIIASAIETFGRGKWRLYDYKIDYFKGFSDLHRTYLANKEHVLTVNYEQLILNSEAEKIRIFDYLELDSTTANFDDFASVQLNGGAGDPTGTRNYNKLSTEPLEKWKSTLANPVRKAWIRHYIHWLGQQRLTDIGYNYPELITDVKSINTTTKCLLSDSFRLTYGIIANTFETRIFSEKIKKMPSWTDIVSHL